MIPGSDRDHPTFVQSFRYAIEGLLTAIRTERNINVMLVLGVVTVVASIAWGSTPSLGASSSFAADLSSLLSCATPQWKRSSTSPRRSFIPWRSARRISLRPASTFSRSRLRLWASSSFPTPSVLFKKELP